MVCIKIHYVTKMPWEVKNTVTIANLYISHGCNEASAGPAAVQTVGT